MRKRPLGLIVLYIVTVVVDVILMVAKVNIAVIFFVNFVVIFAGYILAVTISNQRWVNILEEDCDPERFLEECEKKRKFSRRVAYQNVCSVNFAVGLMSLGRYDEALGVLGEVDMNVKNSKIIKTAYHLALFCAYLDTDNLDKAAYEYENHLKESRKGVYDPNVIFCLDSNVLEYHYKLNKTTETARLYLEQLDYLKKAYWKRLKKRQKLGAIFTKAQLLSELGEYEEATKKYEVVATNGNGLWIALKAKELI